LNPFLYGVVCLILVITQVSGAPKPASGPVSGWIQPIVMLLVLPELAPLMPDPHALSKPPAPAATAPAPTPASTDRRVTGRPGSGLLPPLSGPMSSPPTSHSLNPLQST